MAMDSNGMDENEGEDGKVGDRPGRGLVDSGGEDAAAAAGCDAGKATSSKEVLSVAAEVADGEAGADDGGIDEDEDSVIEWPSVVRG